MTANFLPRMIIFSEDVGKKSKCDSDFVAHKSDVCCAVCFFPMLSHFSFTPSALISGNSTHWKQQQA
jgi:hypothetical protein